LRAASSIVSSYISVSNEVDVDAGIL